MTSRPVAADSVPDAFDTIARDYDTLIGTNPGYHQHLRLSARRLSLPGQGEGLRLLDLGCGTGASTAALLEVLPRAEIVAVDASAGMLAAAKAKSWPSRVRFVHARVEELEKLGSSESPAGVHGPFDGVLAAYLVRNLPDPDQGLRTIYQLLRPGAPVAVHDYSVTDRWWTRVLWTVLCWGVIIPAGSAITGNAEIYRYLWRSVRAFDGASAFVDRLSRLGFVDIRRHTMPGWQRGIVHTFVGRRPRTDQD